MKKIYILIALAIVGIGSWCAVTTTATTTTNIDMNDYTDSDIIDMGTVLYCNTRAVYLDVNFVNITHEQDLMLIYTMGIIDNATIKHYHYCWYNSSNTSIARFEIASIVDVPWYFENDTKEVLFHDTVNNQLYRFYINYSEITIPENPYEEIIEDYNLKNETLANITQQFDNITALYNLTMHQFNMTMAENHNLSENMTNLTTALNNLEDEYDNRTALWNSALNSSIYYETIYNDKTSDYEQLEKDHNNMAGAVPWYILIGILGTFLFTYIYVRRKNIFDAPSDTTDEITTGYGKIHSSIDKHVLSRFRKEPKTDEGKIEEINEWEEVPKEKFIDDVEKGKITSLTIEKSEGSPKHQETKKETPKTSDNVLTIIHGKIDANARATNIKIDANAREINTKIDRLFEGIDERINQLSKETKA